MIFQLRLPFYPLPITQVSKQFKEISINKFNHTLSGMLLSEGIIAFKCPSLLTWQGFAYVIGDVHAFATVFPVVACPVIGAVFPDVDMRIPGLEHRTITHWPIIYGVGLILAYLAGYLWLFLFCIGCLVHILLDSLSLMGVPVLTPFGKREGFRIMRVGSYTELLCSVIMIVGVFSVWLLIRKII